MKFFLLAVMAVTFAGCFSPVEPQTCSTKRPAVQTTAGAPFPTTTVTLCPQVKNGQIRTWR